MSTTTDLRPITISTATLYTANAFGHTEEKADENMPKWVAEMEKIAKRDGVDLTITSRQIVERGQERMLTVEWADEDYEEGECEHDAESSWFQKADTQAWEAVNA